MKIAVIAADGRTGHAFVKAALAAGHHIQAGAREGSSLEPGPSLQVVPCDATNPAQVKALLQGQDAVVSFIGHVKGSHATVQTDAINTALSVMKKLGMKRIVSLTGTGVRFPEDKITLIDRILNLSIRLIDPRRVRDGIQHVEALKASELDWTVLRVLKLQNTSAGDFLLTPNGPTKPYVSRQETAQAALQVLEQASFIRQAPILSPLPKQS
jgi:putative NADH-flavin reductase